MNTIISKRTTPFVYTKWVYANGQFFRDGDGIIINGGSGVVGGNELLSGKPLSERGSAIPVGVMTFVDDIVLEKLMSIGKFRKDIERGIITVVKGQKIDQDKADDIASKDMLPDEYDPSRPVTPDEISAAGGKINKDGSVDISDVDDDNSPLRIRKIEAGLSFSSKKRLAEERKRKSAEKKSATRSRRK